MELTASNARWAPSLASAQANQASVVGFRVGAVEKALRCRLETRAATTVRPAEGSIRYWEDNVDGLEKTPEAFIEMPDGRNFGKLIVRV